MSDPAGGKPETTPESPAFAEARFSDNDASPDNAEASPLGIVKSIVRSE